MGARVRGHLPAWPEPARGRRRARPEPHHARLPGAARAAPAQEILPGSGGPMSSTAPCDSTRLVDAHFGRGGLPPRRERALREHLPGCTTCRARYERHLLLAEVDRSIPGAQERLARGLGLPAAPR